DITWQKLYHKHKGKIDVAFAKEAFSSPVIAAPSSLDAKFTTTELARQLKSWALFGPPTGKTWNPTAKQKELYPEIKPLVSNPWTVLGTVAPPKDVGQEAPVLAAGETKSAGPKGGFGFNASLPPAWRGTLLPASDADVWLATAFADYERAVAGERAALKKGEKPEAARDQLDKAVGFFRKTYSSVSAKLDVPLAEIKSSTASDDWYRLASSK